MEFSHSGMDDDEMQPTSNWKQEEREPLVLSLLFSTLTLTSLSLSLSLVSHFVFVRLTSPPRPLFSSAGEKIQSKRGRERKVREFER